MQHIKKKIVILLRNNLSDYDYKRFSIEYLKLNSDLDFYDLQNFCLKEEDVKKNTKLINSKKVNGYKQLYNELRDNKKDHIISFLGHPRNFKEFFLYLLILKFKIPITFIDIAPKVSGNFSRKNKLVYYFSNPTKALYILKNFIFIKFYKSLALNFDNIIIGGKADINERHRKFKNLILSCSIDYQLFLQSKKIEFNNNDYCIFLDDDLPEHEDYKKNNIDYPINDKNKYYENLSIFFEKYEKTFNTKLIIAAHPKRKKNYFDGFEHISFKTADLVKSCKNVLVHASSSLSFAILNRKPLIFLTSDEIKQNWMGPRITNLALETKSQTLNIDHVNNQDLKKLKYELKVNSNAYENYERNFLFNDKKMKNIWESYIKFIYDKSNKSK